MCRVCVSTARARHRRDQHGPVLQPHWSFPVSLTFKYAFCVISSIRSVTGVGFEFQILLLCRVCVSCNLSPPVSCSDGKCMIPGYPLFKGQVLDVATLHSIFGALRDNELATYTH